MTQVIAGDGRAEPVTVVKAGPCVILQIKSQERYTVLRGPHIDKKSREQFEIRTHKRIIDITEPTARTVEAINRIQVPAGVFVKIKT